MSENEENLGDFELRVVEPAEEYISYECTALPTGDIFMKFENNVELYVADLPHYFELSANWSEAVEGKHGNVINIGFMPREDYAKLCVEAAEWAVKGP